MEVVHNTSPTLSGGRHGTAAAIDCPNWRLRLTLTSPSEKPRTSTTFGWGRNRRSSNSQPDHNNTTSVAPHKSEKSTSGSSSMPSTARISTSLPSTSQSSAFTTEANSPDSLACSETASPISPSSSSSLQTTRLYVGNLPYAAQRSHVAMIFLQAGFNVTDSRINMSTDPMTGRNPSFCFVEMFSIEEARRAMELVNGKEVLGRNVKVNVATPPRRGSTGSTMSTVSSVSNVSAGSAASAGSEGLKLRTKSVKMPWRVQDVEGTQPYSPTFDRWRRHDAASHWQKPVSEGRRLFVGGLPRMEPQSAVDAAMQSLFSSYHLEAVSKIISPATPSWTSDRDRYYLFVDLEDAGEIPDAIERLHGMKSPWGKGRLTISKAKDGKGRKVVREQGL